MSIYMKIEGIDGDVTAKGHENYIEIFEFSFKVERAISSYEPGRETDRESTTPSFSEVSIHKYIDQTSPKLFLEACTGKAKKVIIDFCETSDNLQTYMQFTLTDAIISSYALGGDSDDKPRERITLNYAQIEQKFTPYDSKHNAKSPIPAGYNLATAAKV